MRSLPRHRLAVAGALAACLFLFAAALAWSPKAALALGVGLTGVAAVLWQPFIGIVTLVLASQLTEVMRSTLPAAGDLFFEGVAVVTLAGVALNSFREARRRRWGADVLAVRLALLFALSLLLSFLFAEDVEAGLEGLRKILGVVLLFFLVVCTIVTRRRLELALAAILVSTCISSGIAVIGAARGTRLVAVENATDDVRQAGGAADPTMSSQAMLAGSALGALLALRTRKWRLLGVATVLLGTLGIVLSYSRSTAILWLALAVWLLFKQRRSRWLPLVIVPVLLVGIAALSVLPESYWDRLSALSDPAKDWTLERRVGYHVIAFDLMRSHPILGVGPGNFQVEYLSTKYRWAPGRVLEPRALHNMYLGLIVENGWVGFACFAALLASVLIALRRARHAATNPELRTLAEALQFAFAGYLVAAAVAPAQTAKYTWILMALAAVFSRFEVWSKEAPAAEPSPSPLHGGAKLVVSG